MSTFFENFGVAFDGGEVTDALLSEWLIIAYPDEAGREIKRSQVYSPTGVVKFQASLVHRKAKDIASGEASRLEALAAEMRSETPKLEVPAELLADVPDAGYEDAPLPDIAAEIKKRIGVIEAVRKWGKPQDRIRDSRTESVKVRCPFPSHTDHSPSAWCNTEKNTWYCGKCEVGGDVIDFYVARTRDLRPTDFHRSSEFNAITREIAETLGFSIKKSSSGSWEMVSEEEDPIPLPDRPEEEVAAPSDEIPAVIPPSFEADEPITITDDEMTDAFDFSAYVDWRDYHINPGSFLGEWMQFAESRFNWLPQEYFFFLGLQAIGMAMGQEVYSITDDHLACNLMITLIGNTGAGKSTAVGQLKAMLDKPGVRFDPETGDGIKKLPNPVSAEALVDSIKTMADDPEDAAKKVEVPTTGWLSIDELSDFAAKASRAGTANLKPTMIELFDFVKDSEHPKISHESRKADRSGGEVTRRVLHDSHLSVTFTTQNQAIRELMTKTDLFSGFLNRIIPIMGNGRERRTYERSRTVGRGAADEAFVALWHRCRDHGRREVPFTDETFLFMNTSEEFRSLESRYMSPLQARAQLFVFKIAVLLAVNNGEPVVHIEHFSDALSIVRNYVLEAFSTLERDVNATETDDAAADIIRYVREHARKHGGKWPNKSEYNRSYVMAKYSLEVRTKTFAMLMANKQIVEVKIKSSGAGRPKLVLVIPEGPFEWCIDYDGKAISEAMLYLPGGGA